MNCPICSKTYPDELTECPFCAGVATGRDSDSQNYGYGTNLEGWWDVPPDVAKNTLAAKEVPPKADESGTWAKLLKSSSDKFRTEANDATLAGQPTGFILPSLAHLENHQAEPTDSNKKPRQLDDSNDSWGNSAKPEKPQAKPFGRSAEIEESPLHDSWSSRGDGRSSAKTGPGKEPQTSEWAAKLQAAASHPPTIPVEPAQTDEALRAAAVAEKIETLSRTESKPEGRKLRAMLFKVLTGLIVVLLLGSIMLVARHSLAKGEAARTAGQSSESETSVTDDATIWLDSAEESLESKDFQLAAAQLERAVDFLKKGDEKRLKEAQTLLAETYIKAENYSAGAALWTELAKRYPDLRKRGANAAASALRANRVIANQRVKTAEQAVAKKDYDKAIKLATEALRIYQLSQGENAQKARAYGVLGDAYWGQQNTRVAFSHFTKAQKLHPQGRYGNELSKLKLPVRPKPRKTVEKVRPKFVTETDVPQASSRR